jgi:hypothetical protein
MSELILNDRDIFAIYKVLNKAMEEAEFCFDGTRHARLVLLNVKNYIDAKLRSEPDYEKKLNLNP